MVVGGLPLGSVSVASGNGYGAKIFFKKRVRSCHKGWIAPVRSLGSTLSRSQPQLSRICLFHSNRLSIERYPSHLSNFERYTFPNKGDGREGKPNGGRTCTVPVRRPPLPSNHPSREAGLSYVSEKARSIWPSLHLKTPTNYQAMNLVGQSVG